MVNDLYSIDSNAFEILKATYVSTRAEISELVENAEFNEIHSLDQIQRAQQSLLAPITRLEQELGWLPELSFRQINDISTLLCKNNPKDICKAIEFLPELAKTNILAHLCGITRIEDIEISEIIKTWDDIDEEYLLKFINVQRKLSGFPQVEQNRISIAIISLMKSHARNVAHAIWRQKNPGESMTVLVEVEMSRNSSGLFLSSLIQEYDRQSESYLIRIEQDIDHLIKRISHENENRDIIIDEIFRFLYQWNNINRPVQLFEQYQGHENKRPKNVCEKLRALCLGLANRENQFYYAKQLSEVVLHVFSEIESITKTFKDDIETLEDLYQEQQKQFADLDEIVLVAACESAKSETVDLDPAQLTQEYIQKSQCEIIKNVFDAFKVAVNPSKTGDKPFIIIRDLALFMSNDRDDPELAFKLIDELIKHPHVKPSDDLVGILDKDRSMLYDDWKKSEMKK